MLTAQDEAWFSSLVPSWLGGGRGPSSTRDDLLRKEIFAPWPGAAESFGIFANVLFSHNTLVGIMTFGLGMAAGIPTLMLTVYQGLPLGAFIALHYNRDLTVDFLGWLAIHGVTELGALVLFAAGGLVIGEKILFPGRYSRHRESRFARPAGGADGGRRRPHAVRGGDPRRRLSPAGAEHAVAFRHRLRRRRAVARLFLLRRQGKKAGPAKGAAAMTLTHERTSEFFEGGRRERRQIITPEGVPVTVELADHGERLIAFVLDLFIWLLLTLAIYIPIIWALGSSGGSLIAISIALFIGFLIRNLYFVTFELAWRGSTPGKRLVGLRVIDRAGGPLMPSAIIARNLTREVEMFIPLGHADDLGKDRRRAAWAGRTSRSRYGCCSSRRCRSSTATACAAAT